MNGQIIAHDIQRDGRQAEKKSDPDAPIAMRTPPVRTRVVGNMLAIRYSLPVMGVFTLTHRFPLNVMRMRCSPAARGYTPARVNSGTAGRDATRHALGSALCTEVCAGELCLDLFVTCDPVHCSDDRPDNRSRNPCGPGLS